MARWLRRLRGTPLSCCPELPTRASSAIQVLTNQLLVGNAGNDVINSGGGAGTIVAGDGNNTIGTLSTGGGNVLIKTGNGNNTIVRRLGQ